MTLAQSMLPEFDQEMANTRKTLERIPGDKLDFTPHEKSMTMVKLGAHIAEMVGWTQVTLQTPELNFEGWQPPPPPTSVAEILAVFDKNLPEARAALAAATDEEMAVVWTIRSGDQVFMALPRAAMLRGMVFNHIIHHRAQLTIYLRMNGVPLPALYGPSADEK